MLSFPFLLIWIETAASYFIAFWYMLSVMFLMLSWSFHCEKEANKKLSSLYFYPLLWITLLRNLGNMNFKLKCAEEFSCSARRQNSLILKYSLCSFFYQCGLKKSQAASFAKPEIWLTLLLVVSHATGRAVVGWGWGLQLWNLWRTVSHLPDFPHAGWKWVLVLGLSVAFSSCWLFT